MQNYMNSYGIVNAYIRIILTSKAQRAQRVKNLQYTMQIQCKYNTNTMQNYMNSYGIMNAYIRIISTIISTSIFHHLLWAEQLFLNSIR